MADHHYHSKPEAMSDTQSEGRVPLGSHPLQDQLVAQTNPDLYMSHAQPNTAPVLGTPEQGDEWTDPIQGWGAGGHPYWMPEALMFDPAPYTTGISADFPLYASNDPQSIDLGDKMRVPAGTSIPPVDAIHENGRTYQGYREDRYFLPNDPQEQDRLDFQHMVSIHLMNGALHLAPIGRPRKILDLATGTGIWAIEISRAHRQADVIGTDLSLIQPGPQYLPGNVSFIREDVEDDEWTLPLGFDFIHVRAGYTAFKDHLKILRNIYKHLSPGGWFEIQDGRSEFMSFDGSSVGSALEKHTQLVTRGLSALGRDGLVMARYKDLMVEAGFPAASIVEAVLPLPCSGWPTTPNYRLAGRFQAVNMDQVVEGTTFKLLQAADMTTQEIQGLADQARKELRSGEVHGYWPVHVIYAQKPWDAE